MDTAPTPRYASHYLRLGRYIARSVLVESLGSGRYRLAPFSAELERTIFLSGTLRLECTTCTLSEEETPEEVTWRELQSLLDGHEGWTLLLPRDRGY